MDVYGVVYMVATRAASIFGNQTFESIAFGVFACDFNGYPSMRCQNMQMQFGSAVCGKSSVFKTITNRIS